MTFLGTGNFSAPGRYWNSFVLDRTVLVEPSPTALPHLRRCGFDVGQLESIVISHFHPDHTFGWPFLALEIYRAARTRPVSVIGPPGVERFLGDMMRFGSVVDIHEALMDMPDVRFVDVDGSWQEAGGLRFRAIEVDHVPDLRCFGFLLEHDGRIIGYSGDTRPCPGLEELAGGAEVLVLECNGAHEPKTHMDMDDVRALRSRHPDLPLVLTHIGEGIDPGDTPGVTMPDDFQPLTQ